MYYKINEYYISRTPFNEFKTSVYCAEQLSEFC